LYEVQFVIVDEANKKISWSPEDVRTWSTERPVWAISLGGRAVFHKKGEEPVGRQLGRWVSDRETEKWRVQRPVADGTLEALKGRMSEMNTPLTLSGGLRIEKPKKADYAVALGRAEAIHALEAFKDYVATEETLCA